MRKPRNAKEMETSKEYYDRIMSDYKSRGARRSLRKYCMDEGVDYQWLLKAQKEYSGTGQKPGTASRFIALSPEGEASQVKPAAPEGGQPSAEAEWTIRRLLLSGPYGELEISGGSMPALLSLMEKLR